MAIAFAFVIHFLIEGFRGSRMRSVEQLLFACLFVLTGFGLVEQFGRKEGFDGFSISAENAYFNRVANRCQTIARPFTLRLNRLRFTTSFEYHIDAVFVSVIKGVPTLEWLQRSTAANWHLWDMMDRATSKRQTLDRRATDKRQSLPVVRQLRRPRPTDIADPEAFIRQQYLDILSREPDESGHCRRG